MQAKDQFPNNELKIIKITEVGKDEYHVELGDDNCPIYKGQHKKKGTVYMTLDKLGLKVRCYNKKCRTQCHPCEHIKTNPTLASAVFNMSIINNYYGKEEETSIEIVPKYDIFENKELTDKLYKGLNETNYDVASLIYELYKNKFNCLTSEKGKCIWYKFNDIMWLNVGETISKLMSTEIVAYYEKLRTNYTNEEHKEEKDDEYRKKIVNKIKS